MRLITAAALVSFIIIEVRPQNHFRNDHFPYAPQFQTIGPGVFSTDNTLYLPPENHNALPYFPMKNHNLPFPLLPPTGTKAPSIYPSPYPLIMSSTMIPNFEDDDDDDTDNINRDKIHLPPMKPPPTQINRNYNNSELNQSNIKEGRTLPKTVQYRHPIDRADIKFPINLGTMPTPVNQTPSNRRMIVTAEMSRSDQSLDQQKSGTFQGPQYITVPPGYSQSTTEPAIPILRLSNEMDLDGSFSYEALGADQTHYVQHSRMENMGSEKEEQVVEGSYSYVGDNGQTYTVHYVADSNGFRAVGDHLPVPPPVPEIIQRAIQYNLEEEKKPPHLRRWHEDEHEQYDNNNREPYREPNHLFNSPPTRNLFTGKAPEAFSHSFPQQKQQQQQQQQQQKQQKQQQQQQQQENNLLGSASNHAPVKTVDFSQEQNQNKPQNNAPIAPQITFLASQGAHVPGPNQQQSISRMFSSVTEKPLPQLMNYEANLDTEEASKALWRWQYGINAYNTNLNKNLISRSSGDDDNVMINFNDMTQEQYSQMINSHIDASTENNKFEATQYPSYKEQNQYSTPQNAIVQNHQEKYDPKPIDLTTLQSFKQMTSTGASVSFPHSNDWYNKDYQVNKNQITQSSTEKTKENESRKFMMSEPYSKIITQKHFNLPTSQTVTQSYDYENDFYEPRKIKAYNPPNEIVVIDKVKSSTTEKSVEQPTDSNSNEDYDNWKKTETYSDQYDEDVKTTTQVIVSSTQALLSEPTNNSKSSFKFTDFIVKEDKDGFKPITTTTRSPEVKETTTAEKSVEDILNNNIFLKTLLKNDNTLVGGYNKETNKHEQPQQNQIKAQSKADKVPKFIHSKPINEIKILKKKPLDVSDVFNYVAMKNHFEPSKVRPKSQMHPLEQYKTRNEKYYPLQEENHRLEKEQREYNEKMKQYQHEERELQGIIKNYKVLQRNNNNMVHQHHVVNEPNPAFFQNQQILHSNLPPLGRAGPTVKAYLPPIYI